MTGPGRAAVLAMFATFATWALGAGTGARAQTQPPPFGERSVGQPAPAPARAAPPPTPLPTTSPPGAAPARAAAPPDEDGTIDDPKVSRRLGTRISVPPPAPVAAPPRAPSPPPVAPIAPAPPPRPPEGDATTPTVVRPYAPGEEGPFRATPPRLKLAWRRFDFVQLGASDSATGIAARETFNSIGFDVYPVSSVVRVGLSTAYGWQSGTWLASGDYFATQTFSLGGQYRELGRFIPFAEGFVGVGYMRRLQFDRTVPTAFWQFGADAGVEIYAARTGYLSVALGYLRPVNGFAQRQQFTTIFVDTWSLKIGVGI